MRTILRTPVGERDRGAALIVVVGVGALVTGLIATAIVFVVAGMRHARDDSDWNAALAAAYAGVDEYQSRLAANPDYVRFGNPTAPFSAGSALLPDVDNPAFGFGDTSAPVPGSEDNAGFRYEVDSSRYYSQGILRVRSTGIVGQETRTIVADLRQSNFVHYLYFTDREIEDPALDPRLSSNCYRYAWSDPIRPEGCGIITFNGGDVINGQVHSNDIIYACNATFTAAVTTSWNRTSGPRYRCNDRGVTPRFEVSDPARPNSPAYLPTLTMPETNTAILQSALEWGCVYTGPTTILLNRDGTMTVRSPSTIQTRPGQSMTNPVATCGTPGTGRNGLGSSTGATVPVPDGGAVYVQDVPTAGDPNASANPPTCRGAGNGVGYPVDGERAPSAVAGVAAYGCSNGDLFVQGTMQGRATLAAENFVYIVDDVQYADDDRDLLGLIGNNMVYVWNPHKESCDRNGRNCRSLGTDSPNITIEAAILSLRSFAVQNTGVAGDVGVLTVKGSIAQAYRGIVQVVSRDGSGYRKNYVYDPRLRTQSPPHFLSPVTSAYGVSTWIETESAVNADGTWR